MVFFFCGVGQCWCNGLGVGTMDVILILIM